MRALFPPPGHSEPCPRRVRAVAGGRTVADTLGAHYVWEHSRYPSFYIPRRDVRFDLLPELAIETEREGHVKLVWAAIDHWFEEDDEIYVHPRDPYKRVDVRESSRTVEVRVEGVTLARSSRPRLLFETSLPTRYYLPPLDVRLDLLVPTSTLTGCPYKGEARYWSVMVGDRVYDDLVWSYPFPVAEVVKIAGLLCFYNERVEITLDGAPA